jgi:hypothetical protein
MLSDSASLILSTKSTVNPCTINTEKTAFTFQNIDLKNIMGEMWDKYDQFALKLVSFSTEGTITVGGSVDGLITYNLRGLEWSNLIYESTGSINNKEWVPVAYAILSTGTPNINPLITNTGYSFNFKKNSRMVDLEFAIGTASAFGVSAFGVPRPGCSYNNVEFHFLFEPVIPGKMNECAFFGFNSSPTLTGSIKRDVPTDRTISSYPDFNMRILCDLFWDKHDNFEIQMAAVQMRGPAVIAGDVRIVPVQMSGLNFVNNGTKQSNATSGLMLNSENAIIGTLILPPNTSGYLVDMAYPVAPVQFKKDGDNVPLTITFKNSENTGPTNVTLTGSGAPLFQIGFYVKPIYGVEKASLYINPWGLTTTETNLGVRDTNYTTFTLKNINLRQVCRSMWDKYDRFNIFLTTVTWHTAVGNATNAAFIIQMEGLDLINQLSLTASNRQTQVATLGSFYGSPTPTTDIRTSGTMASCVTTFFKTRDIVDLTLSAIPLGATAFSAMSPLNGNFKFTIVGVLKDEEQSSQLKQDWMPIA